MITDYMWHQMQSELRAAQSEIRRHAATVSLMVPAVWGMDELRAHYPGLSESEIRAALTKHCGYKGRTGVRVAVHVEQVRKLDALLANKP